MVDDGHGHAHTHSKDGADHDDSAELSGMQDLSNSERMHRAAEALKGMFGETVEVDDESMTVTVDVDQTRAEIDFAGAVRSPHSVVCVCVL